MAWPGATIPTGWLLCDGSLKSINTYGRLYSVITAEATAFPFGANSGSQFVLPSFDGKFLRMGTSRSSATTGGGNTHSHNLTTNTNSWSSNSESAHNHNVNYPAVAEHAHTHSASAASGGGGVANVYRTGSGNYKGAPDDLATTYSPHAHTATYNTTSANHGHTIVRSSNSNTTSVETTTYLGYEAHDHTLSFSSGTIASNSSSHLPPHTKVKYIVYAGVTNG